MYNQIHSGERAGAESGEGEHIQERVVPRSMWVLSSCHTTLNSHGIGHRTKVRRGPCGLFHSDLLLDIAGQLRITRALYRYLHDAQDISSERRSGRHVVEMLRSTSRARCIPTRDLPRVHEGVERRMGARDVVAQCCGVRKTAGRDARCRSRAVVKALGRLPLGR